ncbi:chemotaxis protein CheW [Candidatus Viridilinea mediisalina]|uniref:CheW-like domain-containing protein n=1 Tax=Candidatus Viridilinea mediisalina TaxID=2024553 RepID=A0A2A6RP35_9CHLR|nr:chemotaxis protein CheW [Candidatus Viridilinea mediisalina]PDW04600.1 hypothetical protein CJ255_02810 [Candidatus Viridilinea mediisalina]
MMIEAKPTPSSTDAPLVVTFKVGRQIYALPLSAVLQVVRLPALTVVPGAPPGMCGMLNLRSTFIPVLDARIILGETSAISIESQVIILNASGDGQAEGGLLVDAVDIVRHYPSGSFAAVNGGDALVVGLLRDGAETAVVLDPAVLVMRAQRTA